MLYRKNNNFQKSKNTKTYNSQNLFWYLQKIDIWNVNTIINVLSFLIAVSFLFLVLQNFLNQENQSSSINKSNVRPFTNFTENSARLERGELKPFVAQNKADTESTENLETEKIDPTEEQVQNLEYYEVQAGDTLSAIADKKGLSIIKILDLNPDLSEPFNLFPGQEIRLVE